MSCIVQSLLDPWENIASESNKSVKSGEVPNLHNVCSYYGIGKKRKKTYCMFLGDIGKSGEVLCAHIWPKNTCGQNLNSFGLEIGDVNNARNFLRLHENIEKNFDKKRLLFEIDAGLQLRLVVLDPKLMEVELEVKGKKITYSDLNNRRFDYTFSEKAKPYRRLIALHAHRAVQKARNMAWIDEDVDAAAFRGRSLELARLSLGDESPIMKAFFE